MASQREILEERLRASGLKPAEARSVATKVLDAQNPAAAWDAIFNTSITRKTGEIIDQLFTVRTVEMRAVTFKRIVHNLLARSLYVPLDKARGRRNLEALGMKKSAVDYAVSRHGRVDVGWAESQVRRKLGDKKTGRQAIEETLRTVIQASLIDQVMRGEEVALGDFGILELIITIVSIVLSIVAAIVGWVMDARASKDEEAYLREQRNRPLDDAEIIAATARIIAKYERELATVRWSTVAPEYLRDIKANRSNRSSFVEGEEELCREEFNRQKTDILQAQREIAMIEARGDLEESAVTTARQRNAARAALMQDSFSAVLLSEETQRSETRSKWLRRGLIALGVGGAGVVVYKLASR